MKSKIIGVKRHLYSFHYFNKQLFRWPANFIMLSKKNLAEYGDNKVFQGHVEDLPNWIPLKLRIVWHSASVAWSLSGVDLGARPLDKMRYLVVIATMRTVVGGLIMIEGMSDDLVDEFVKYEDALDKGNFSGSGPVWDFYDDTFRKLRFDAPHVSILDTLRDEGFIGDTPYNKLIPKMKQLDRILVENDAVMYSQPNGEFLLGDYDDVFYTARVHKLGNTSLTELMEMEK